MHSDKLAAIPLNKFRLVDTLNLRDSKIKKQCILLSFPIAILASPLFIVAIITMLINSFFSYLEFFIYLLIAFVLIIPIYILHEIFHYIFQWTFSYKHKKPRLNLMPPWPYSALAPDVHISRRQGVIIAISPILFVTLILVILSIATNPQLKTILLMAAFLHACTCGGDFLIVYWVCRHPKHMRLGTIGLTNAMFELIEDAE
jgi:hypothetical protein